MPSPSPTTTDAVITCDNNSNKEKVPLVQEEETPSTADVVATKIPDESDQKKRTAAVDTSTINRSSSRNLAIIMNCGGQGPQELQRPYIHLVYMGHIGW